MKKGLSIVVVLAILASILLLLYRFPPADYIDNEYIDNLIGRLGWLGIVGFYVVGAMVTAVGFPRQLIAFIGGFVFGNFVGSILAIAAAITGCYLCFVTSRRYLRSSVYRRFGSTVDLINRFIKNDAFLKIVILRLQPFGTNLITNLSAGVSAIPTSVFIGSSLIGYVPQTVVFSLMGSGIRVNSSMQMMVSAVLFVLSLIMGVYLYKKRPVHERGLD